MAALARGRPRVEAKAAVFDLEERDPRGQVQTQVSLYLGETTNNVAEYQALILGLKEAVRLEVRRLQVFADSQLLVRQLNGQYRVKAPHLLPFWRVAKDALQKFESYTISHVPRAENRQADELANQAIDQKEPAR